MNDKYDVWRVDAGAGRKQARLHSGLSMFDAAVRRDILNGLYVNNDNHGRTCGKRLAFAPCKAVIEKTGS